MVRIPNKTGRSRASFTLIEVLVVVAIITILMALTAAAIMAVNKQAVNKATQGIIGKLGPALDKVYRAVAAQATSETIPPPALNAFMALSTDSTGKPNAARARVFWVKARLKQAFPQNIAEAFQPVQIPPIPKLLPAGFTMPGLPGYISFLSSKGVGSPAAVGTWPQQAQQAQSAICLLMVLQRNVSGVGLTADVLAPSNIMEFPIASGTIPGLVDAYNTPLIYCRWPTQDPILNPFKNPLYDMTQYPRGLLTVPFMDPAKPPPVGFFDPQDPQGTLTAKYWINPSMGSPFAIFQQVFHDLPTPDPKYPNQWPLSYRMQPIITSAGQDMAWTNYPPVAFNPTGWWTPGGWGPGIDPRTFREMDRTSQDNLSTIRQDQ